MEEAERTPKYSILLPAYNGGAYLQSCIGTVLRQKYSDFELVISDDHSIDGTGEYLKTVNDPRVRIIFPTARLSMAEHWNWLLLQARGQWLIFVGQDDGLQAHFFQLAERLTKLAENRRIRVIMSERAYYFWPGCQQYYGDAAIVYFATPATKILRTTREAISTLLGIQQYFDLPSMYTTSLFHRSIVEEVKSRQNGRIFVTHPQDANLAAIACTLERKYLKSLIPLGWVGSSPKSAGLAVTADDDGRLLALKNDYLAKTNESKLKCSPLIGDFSIGSCVLYFWGALLETAALRHPSVNWILSSRLMRKVALSGALEEISSSSSRGQTHRIQLLDNAMALNGLSCKEVRAFQESWMRFIRLAFGRIADPLGIFKNILFALVRRTPFGSGERSVHLLVTRSEAPGVTIEEAEQKVRALMTKLGFD